MLEIRKQRLEKGPLLVSQVVTIMHTSYLPQTTLDHLRDTLYRGFAPARRACGAQSPAHFRAASPKASRPEGRPSPLAATMHEDD